MISIKKPSKAKISAYLEKQQKFDFNYPYVGDTLATPPDRYLQIRKKIELGYGKDVFDSACQALFQWQMFDLKWVSLMPPQASVEPGVTVGILAKKFGFWYLNACKIIQTIDETSDIIQKFGLIYGTLNDHIMKGEEIFLIEWDKSDDSVWYSIYSFSKLNRFYSKLGRFFARRYQKVFVRDSLQKMKQVCSLD